MAACALVASWAAVQVDCQGFEAPTLSIFVYDAVLLLVGLVGLTMDTLRSYKPPRSSWSLVIITSLTLLGLLVRKGAHETDLSNICLIRTWEYGLEPHWLLVHLYTNLAGASILTPWISGSIGVIWEIVEAIGCQLHHRGIFAEFDTSRLCESYIDRSADIGLTLLPYLTQVAFSRAKTAKNRVPNAL
jgi:hypothetical protein